MEGIFLKYGIYGAGFVAMGWFIMYVLKEHKKERAEWKESMEKQFDKLDEREKETNKAIQENTNILTSLKTLFEKRR